MDLYIELTLMYCLRNWFLTGCHSVSIEVEKEGIRNATSWHDGWIPVLTEMTYYRDFGKDFRFWPRLLRFACNDK